MTMPPIVRRLGLRPIDGLIVLLAILTVTSYAIFAAVLHDVGFPLDDSWIHQTYARNLADHGEWSFVPGTPSAASTAPLYSFLLAFGHLIGLSPFVWAHFLGIVALSIAGIISIRLAERLFPNLPWVGPGTGILIVTTWHIIWAAASGMETMLFMALSLAIIALSWREIDYFATTSTPSDSPQNENKPSANPSPMFDGWERASLKRGLQFGLVGGLLFLTRPEGIILLGLASLFILIGTLPEHRKPLIYWIAGTALGFLLIVTPYVIFNYSETDGFLPSTASAKIAENAPLREHFILRRYLRMLLPVLIGAQIMWLPGIIWGISNVKRRLIRREWSLFLPLLWGFIHLSLYAIRLPAPYQHGRYVIPILPPFLLFAVGGMALIVQAGKDTPLKRVLTRTLALSAVLAVVGFWYLGGQAYARDVRFISTEMVKTAKWIESHPDIIPPDDLLATHDIGAVGYFASRDIFDLAGLVSPEVVPIILDPEALLKMMCEKDIHWLMVLPEQQPAKDDDPRLELIYSTDEPYIFEIGGEGNMKVFRLHFSESCGVP